MIFFENATAKADAEVAEAEKDDVTKVEAAGDTEEVAPEEDKDEMLLLLRVFLKGVPQA